MASTIQVEAARIPDRDRLLRHAPRGRASTPTPHDEVGIEVPTRRRGARRPTRCSPRSSGSIMDLGAPFVPIKHEGVIYIRPPTS